MAQVHDVIGRDILLANFDFFLKFAGNGVLVGNRRDQLLQQLLQCAFVRCGANINAVHIQAICVGHKAQLIEKLFAQDIRFHHIIPQSQAFGILYQRIIQVKGMAQSVCGRHFYIAQGFLSGRGRCHSGQSLTVIEDGCAVGIGADYDDCCSNQTANTQKGGGMQTMTLDPVPHLRGTVDASAAANAGKFGQLAACGRKKTPNQQNQLNQEVVCFGEMVCALLAGNIFELFAGMFQVALKRGPNSSELCNHACCGGFAMSMLCMGGFPLCVFRGDGFRRCRCGMVAAGSRNVICF